MMPCTFLYSTFKVNLQNWAVLPQLNIHQSLFRLSLCFSVLNSNTHTVYLHIQKTASLTHIHLCTHLSYYLSTHRMPSLAHNQSCNTHQLLHWLSLQTVPHQLSCSESGEPAFQRGGSARRVEGCLPAVVQRLSLPGAECTKVTEGTCVMNRIKGHYFTTPTIFLV